MSSLSFYILKFIPDPVRQEPRNLGILIWTPNLVYARLAGTTTDQPWSVDGRRIGGGKLESLNTYKQWIMALQDLINSKRIQNLRSQETVENTSPGFIDALKTWCNGSILLTNGGEIFLESPEESIQPILDSLYETYVAPSSVAPGFLKSGILRRVESLDVKVALQNLINSTPLKEDPYLIKKKTIRCEVRGIQEDLEFSYAYENGALHRLIQTIELPKRREQIRQNVQSSAWMFDRVLNQNIVKDGQIIAAMCFPEERLKESEVGKGVSLIASMATIWNLADAGRVSQELRYLPTLSIH